MQDFSESWTDEKLYKKYGLTQDEIAFIESMIRPMEITEGENVWFYENSHARYWNTAIFIIGGRYWIMKMTNKKGLPNV